MGPLTAQTPKCLLQIDGRVLLDWQLQALAGAGVDDITVVAGFMADAVVRHVANRCRVVVNEQYATTNSITSLNLAEQYLRGHGFLLQNGDVLYPVDLIRRLVAAPHSNACLVDSVRPYEPGEYHVEVTDGRVSQYSNTLPPEHSVGQSAQLLRVGAGDSGAFLDRIAQLVSSGGSGGFPNQAYDVLMIGHGLWPVFTAGLPWWEVDTADDLAHCNAANAATSSNRVPHSTADPAPQPLTAARVASFFTEPRLPWRLRWLPVGLGSMFRHPGLVSRGVRALHAGQLSLDGLDLAVNGRRLLRIALSEARAAGFEPFLLWGTLLGNIRDGGFIWGDHDIDLGVMDADVDRLVGYRGRMRRRGFTVRIENDDKLSMVHPHHPHLFIDIDVVRRYRDGWCITNRDADPQKIFRYHFPAGVFAGTKRARFAQRLTTRIPGDADAFLAAAYGDWRIRSPKADYRYGPLNTEVELVSQTPVRRVSAPPATVGSVR